MLTGDRERADDLVQDAFVHLARRFAHLRDQAGRAASPRLEGGSVSDPSLREDPHEFSGGEGADRSLKAGPVVQAPMDGNYPDPPEEEPHQRPGEKLGTGHVADGSASHRGGQADGERIHPLTWFEARMAGPLPGMCSVPTRRHRNAARRMSSVPITVTPHQGSSSTQERKRVTLTAGVDAISPRSHNPISAGPPRHSARRRHGGGPAQTVSFCASSWVHVRSI